MLMMLQMLWMMTTLPLCWKVLSIHHHCKKHKLIVRRYQGLTMWFLPRSGVFHPKKYKIWFVIPHSMVSTQCCTHPSLGSLGQTILSWGIKDYDIMCIVHFLPLQCIGSNRCAQIFATHFGWSCSFPIKLKSKTHEAFSLLFQWDGTSPAIICDNAKELILGDFNKKHKEVLCHQSLKFIPHFKTLT